MSQRSMNPREFFRQLSSSSSQSPTSPGSSRTGMYTETLRSRQALLKHKHQPWITVHAVVGYAICILSVSELFSFSPGKPFRRYQRSLTDTAFIFSKAEGSTSTSPYSSPLVSPFARAPPSPIYRATSPPTSPDFRPVTSPERPRAPMSPPTLPLRPAPPVSALPSVPQTNSQVQTAVEPKPPSPTEPSAPPASPTLLASLSPVLVKNNPSQSHPEALPASPPNTPTEPEHSTFCFESPQAPTAPLPERPRPNTGTMEQDTNNYIRI